MLSGCTTPRGCMVQPSPEPTLLRCNHTSHHIRSKLGTVSLVARGTTFLDQAIHQTSYTLDWRASYIAIKEHDKYLVWLAQHPPMLEPYVDGR